MASKTTVIPRFLLPQHGPLWRSTTTTATTRTRAFARPSPSSTASTTSSRASSTNSTAARAAKHSAPTKKSQVSSAATTGASAATKSAPNKAGPSTAAAAAGPPSSKPIVLEKPERFNPPSHGKRLPRSVPKHYGGAATAEEVQARKAKQYPGLPPPDNTWSHWVIHSRGIHLFITLGTLTSLTIYTFAANFQAKSPFADLIPPLSELWRHPVQYAGVCVDVLRMHEEHESIATAERRRRRVDDVAKRNEYRKAHGLEPTQGWWGGSSPIQSRHEEQPDAPAAAAADGGSGNGGGGIGRAEPQPTAAPAADLVPESEGKRQKFLGIF
ncbi:hypothetical protein SLS62_004219 [Diatrype stigma]|uniref:Uncharacterized protein n=1 Tax=Diatrype stigma TaxID=117547 RepID=A0AAN9UTQ9_9PEZI